MVVLKRRVIPTEIHSMSRARYAATSYDDRLRAAEQ
jgi:hypothetical protein